MTRNWRAMLFGGLGAALLWLVGSFAFSAEPKADFDREPILEHNQAWLHPKLDQVRSVAFTHAMAPVAVEERFAWRQDGASLVELLKWPWGAHAVGQQTVTTPEPALHFFAAASKYAAQVAVELFGSRYGDPQPPAEDFHIYLLDANQKVIQDVPCPYARIERGQQTWYTLSTPPTEVPREFYVGLWFNAHQTKGVFVGKDTDVQESHSYTGTPEKGYQPVDSQHDWMIRVRMAPKDVAEKVALTMRDAPAQPAIPAPLLASAEDQAKGREILRKLADANRYWLSGPPPAVRSYSYEFQLDGQTPAQIEVDAEKSGGGPARQGISYYSPIHYLTRDPGQIPFRRVEIGEERITLQYLLAEPTPVAMGNGISGTWRGFFSTRVREGTLVVDAKRFVPLEHTAKGLHETWSEYVDLGESHFAPLGIDVEHDGMRFGWKFRVYEPGLWLFAFAPDAAAGDDKKLIASADKVRVNGEEAKIKYTPRP